MNPQLAKLNPYPFAKLNQLKQGCTPCDKTHIALSIGEPAHSPPAFIGKAVIDNLHSLATYPTTTGMVTLRQTIANWLNRRFNLDGNIDADSEVLPVNGTREALFAFAQAVINPSTNPIVAMPNPFYQIYEGAAIMAGAEPYFLHCAGDNNFIPNFASVSEHVWDRCQLLYLCSPGNPTGAVIDETTLIKLIELAHQHDFIIACDECYSEIYIDENKPPASLLQAAVAAGFNSLSRCVVFHSLSKRSNAPGLRSGFVAGDAEVLKTFCHYRTYHGCTMPIHTQLASIAAWQDEQHVADNRQRYREKFNAVFAILSPIMKVTLPQGGFYLWAQTPIADTDFARQLFIKQNVTVLPGSYLARETYAGNPGNHYVRMALVAPLNQCVEAAHRIKTLISTL